MEPKQSDPVVDEVRDVRRRISREVNNDPKRLVDHYLELQKQYRERLLKAEDTRETKDAM